MNDATVTLQILDIGYFKDLVFYGLSDGTAIEDDLDEGLKTEKNILVK